MTPSPVWRPFTQHATEPAPPVVHRTGGAYLHTDRGRLIDAVSSWWVVTHGHRHPPIMQAIHDAAERLDQVVAAADLRLAVTQAYVEAAAAPSGAEVRSPECTAAVERRL